MHPTKKEVNITRRSISKKIIEGFFQKEKFSIEKILRRPWFFIVKNSLPF
jgi:hypothetical protein